MVRINYQFHIVPLSTSNHFIRFNFFYNFTIQLWKQKQKTVNQFISNSNQSSAQLLRIRIQQIIHYAQPTILYLYMYGNFLVMPLLSNSAHIANQSSILFLENRINLYWLTWTIKSRNMILEKTKQATFTKNTVNMISMLSSIQYSI